MSTVHVDINITKTKGDIASEFAVPVTLKAQYCEFVGLLFIKRGELLFIFLFIVCCKTLTRTINYSFQELTFDLHQIINSIPKHTS